MRNQAPEVLARARVLESSAGRAHTDVQTNDKAGALRHGVHRTTHRRWRHGHRGSPLEAAGRYLLNCADPWRAWASMRANQMWAQLQGDPTDQLVRRWWELNDRAAHHRTESARLTHRLAVTIGPQAAAAQITVASERERLAAAELEQAAIEKELASRGVNPAAQTPPSCSANGSSDSRSA